MKEEWQNEDGTEIVFPLERKIDWISFKDKLNALVTSYSPFLDGSTIIRKVSDEIICKVTPGALTTGMQCANDPEDFEDW